jgi:hypothetical protein
VAEQFRKASGEIEAAVARFVYETVKRYPGAMRESESGA